MRKMDSTSKKKISFVIFATSGLVLIAALASWNVANDAFIVGMIPVWTAIIFITPLAFGVCGILVLSGNDTHNNEAINKYSASVFLLGLSLLSISYAMCILLISRVHAVWWEHVKFGGDKISLGASAAVLFTVVALTIGGLSYYAQRFTYNWSVVTVINRATVGIVVLSLVVYLLLGVSPYVQWRA
jgi:hypothetical protein